MKASLYPYIALGTIYRQTQMNSFKFKELMVRAFSRALKTLDSSKFIKC
jgi:hypothetical protein